MRSLVAGIAVVVTVWLWLGPRSGAEAQPPIRIGASVSQTGAYAALGPNFLRGYRLCIKHTNEAGGVLGRKLDLLVEDDRSEPATALRAYDKLITQDRVDAVLGPYSSPITEAVADVTEKHKRLLVASGAASSAIFKKGRRFAFMVLPPAETFFEGLIDIAARRGLKTIALIHEDSLFPRASAGEGRRPRPGLSHGLRPVQGGQARRPDRAPLRERPRLD